MLVRGVACAGGFRSRHSSAEPALAAAHAPTLRPCHVGGRPRCGRGRGGRAAALYGALLGLPRRHAMARVACHTSSVHATTKPKPNPNPNSGGVQGLRTGRHADRLPGLHRRQHGRRIARRLAHRRRRSGFGFGLGGRARARVRVRVRARARARVNPNPKPSAKPSPNPKPRLLRGGRAR